ncbi:MAG: BMP family ABC transporter substrate-binding protein [Spirochaetales bacterium]|nr:BMP family ABC transporter substrate-binding protein [Spirochaetales bacterium]
MNQKTTQRTFTWVLAFLAVAVVLLFPSCEKDNGVSSIGVFVPGVVAGSPTYEMLVQGVTRAVEEHKGIDLQVIEGGFNQGEWKNKIQALASSGEFNLIITSNPAMPQICAEVAGAVPTQRFLVLDGFLKDNPNIYTFRFNQMEQAYLAGYCAGLISSSSMPKAKQTLRAGLIAGQEYPDMNQAIRPGFEFGFLDGLGKERKAEAMNVDFRIVGNWYDPGKGADLASAIYDGGADVILTIAGGANMGVVAAAKEKGGYVLWFDSAGYDIAPGVVVGSSYIAVDRAAYEKTKAAIAGTLPFGTAETGSIKDEWVSFLTDEPGFLDYVTPEIVDKMLIKLEEFRSGNIEMPMPVIR